MDRHEVREEKEVKALVVPVLTTLEFLDTIPAGEFAIVVVVADGDARDEECSALDSRGAQVVRHAVTVGRGAAIRAGIHAALTRCPELDCIAIAEPQHAASDIVRIAQRPEALTLGTTGERRDLPTLLLAGIGVSDPFATLRSIPAELARRLLTLESRGAEFDLETVVMAREYSIPIEEIAIERRGARRVSLGPLLRFLALWRPYRAMTRLLAALCFAVLVGMAGAAVYGFTTVRMFQPYIWMPWGLHRLTHFAALFAGWSVPLLLMFSWVYAMVFPALLAVATTVAAGPRAVLALLFFLASANSLGSVVTRRLPGKRVWNGMTDILSTLLGTGIYALVMTLTARAPVNYPLAWGLVLAAPIVVDRRELPARLRRWFDWLRSIELRDWRERGALVLLIFVLTIHWFGAIMPEYSADGLTMHLAIPADLAAHHMMTFRPEAFVWTVMPMAADFTYSIVYLLGGEAASSLLNFCLLLALTGMLYGAMRRWASRPAALVIAALFVSTPLVNLLTGSLFIENFITAMIFAATLELWRFRETGERRELWLAAIFAGTAASAKLGACAFVVVALAMAAIEARRRRIARPAVVALVLLVVFGAPAYIIAYAKTGNPVFPFLNHRFPSPLLDRAVEFVNNQFTQPLNWKTLFDFTFHTSRYLEGLDGAGGFQYLLLVPFAAIALFASRSYAARVAAAIGLIAGAIVMSSQPYARYVYPSMALLTPPFAAIVARFAERQRKLSAVLFAAMIVCIGLNIYFTPASGWYHKDFYAPAIFRHNGRERVIHEGVPLRDVTMRFRREHPEDHVLLLVEEDLADAGSRADEYHWHQYRVWKEIASSETVAGLRH
ncbi:MAG TPA: hypothetical protein VHW24_20740, partial [Bryobacteraceae bacterium]|nr:hypothetical protein [Bryobacteraceae bacterium]